MYSHVKEVSRVKSSQVNKFSSPCYSIPNTKLKNVNCVACKQRFYVPDLTRLHRSTQRGTRIPLLLDCGHPICNKCKNEKIKKCSLCNKCTEDPGNQKFLPLNLYALGLIVSLYNRPLEDDDDDDNFVFCPRTSMQLRQISKQGCCHECGYSANVNCPQCVALYCHGCYSKIHGRALQSHTQVQIYEGGPYSSTTLLNSCSSTCYETLSYFCNDCNVACCSNCTLHSHKLHEFVALSEKNRTLIPEFNQIYMDIEETLLRVSQTKEKIKSALECNLNESDKNENIEMTITQHFAHLHGVLQNVEAKLINQLYQRRDALKNNLEELDMQLRSQEEKLKVTLQMASYVKQSFHKVDVRNAITILKEMTDLPCHLIHEDIGQNCKATFTVNHSIVKVIEDHCSIQVPPVSLYSLARMDELPENYMMSPIKRKLSAKILEELSLMLSSKKSDSSSTMLSIKSEDMEAERNEDKNQESVSEYKIDVTYVVNPSLFFVRKTALKSQFEQLEQDLTKYGDDIQSVESPIELELDDMCIVKQKTKLNGKWFRGRVNAIFKGENEMFYNIFYSDYGYEEHKIPTSRIRNIAEHLLELPPQAIRCCLHGLVPKNLHWTNASINAFMKLTNKVDCSISIVKSTPDMLYVDLCIISKDNDMGPQSMCNIMKLMDYARLDSSQNITQESKTIHIYNKEELALNKTIMISVCWCENPDKIYVQKIGQQNEISKLENKLREYYNKEDKMIDTPRKGLPCGMQLENGNWQRGEIVEVLNENKVRVYSVDWGHMILLPCNRLRAIPYEYTMFNAQAIRLSLMYVMPESDGSWKPEVFMTLKNLFKRAKCITICPRKKLEDGYASCICSDNVDVSRQLKLQGVVKNYHTNKFKNKSLKNSQLTVSNKRSLPLEALDSFMKDSYTETENENKEPVEKNETSEDPCKMEVSIQRVETPDCIYVAQTEHEASNLRMMSAMQSFYDTYQSELRDNWNEGALCAVYSAKDKSYFRAKILKINSPTDVLVYFYDMGIEETVTMKDIQILHMKFAKEATYCLKVKLTGILPCGGSSTWPSFSCMVLSDFIQENAHCKYYITKPVQEEAYNDAIPVELWVRQTKIPGPLAPTKIEINSVNRMLVEKGVALPIKNYFAKLNTILATEFKRQLDNNHQYVLTKEYEEEIKWFKKEFNIDLKKIDETLLHESDSSCYNSSADALSNLIVKNQIQDSTNRERPVKFSNWLPPIEITEQKFNAIPTYVDNKCAVYLHPKKHNADTIYYIESKLQTHYKNFKIKEGKEWKKGDICIARYHHNQKWYRGRITKNLGNTLMVEFVDYGNVEECEKEHVTDYIRLRHIPIQCTKCIISRLKPEISKGKWMLEDLDKIHALIVEQECEVSILQRQPTHLTISITLLRPEKCDLLSYLVNCMNMNITIDHKELDESESLKSDSSRDVIIKETIINNKLCTVNTSEGILSDVFVEDIKFAENVISGNSAEINPPDLDLPNTSDKQVDFENIAWMEKQLKACSTPDPELEEEENVFNVYKQLIIPQETKYIELILCCNKDPITSFAQLAENNDPMFPNVFHDYYLQYTTMMSDLQTNAYHQPLIESFENNTPCVTKFSDGMWYRCIITNSKKILDQYIQISLYYVDYGNHEYKIVDLLSTKHSLHVPKEEWLELPAMTIKCTFWGLNFVSNDIPLLASKLNEIYNQTTVVARVKEINNENNSIVAEIYKNKTCKELFYAHLIKEDLYQFKNSEEN